MERVKEMKLIIEIEVPEFTHPNELYSGIRIVAQEAGKYILFTKQAMPALDVDETVLLNQVTELSTCIQSALMFRSE
jgi:hypothetical protein